MNSTDRFSTVWRLWRISSDWWANENECSDSEGKRDRSSEKLGDDGPAGSGMAFALESINVMDVERERPTDGLLED
jgi:hypothetical protein